MRHPPRFVADVNVFAGGDRLGQAVKWALYALAASTNRYETGNPKCYSKGCIFDRRILKLDMSLVIKRIELQLLAF
jgi:hypothetical protein